MGAVAALSVLVLGACVSTSGPDYPVEVVTDLDTGDTADDEGEPEDDEVVARCVKRDSDHEDAYEVVSDQRCDGVGKHAAYMWYYGGRKVKGLVRDGTTRRPRDSYVINAGGDEIGKTGKIVRDGFGGRTTVGS